MFSDRATPIIEPTRYPPAVQSFVSEISHADQSAAEMQIWRELQQKQGVVWHRQSDPILQVLSQSLATRSDELKPRQDGYALITNEDTLHDALQLTVRGSQLASHGILSAEQITYLEDQYRSMYKLLSLITGDPNVVIDLRFERDGAYIENFHQDFGTALLMTLAGPGPHFINPENTPVEHDGTFFRQDLPRPNEVLEVPTCSLLAMRGKPVDSETLPVDGLWHSSPCKIWNGAIQWDYRVLLIATSPTSRILPAPPNFQI